MKSILLACVIAASFSACSDKPRAVDKVQKPAPLADAVSALTEIANQSPGPGTERVPTPSPSPPGFKN